MPLTGRRGLHRFVWNNSENSLNQDLSNDTTLSPPLFSLVNTFKMYSVYSTAGAKHARQWEKKLCYNINRQSTNRHPTTRNQQQPSTAILDNLQSAFDNRHPTTKNQQQPLTATPDNLQSALDNRNPTTRNQEQPLTARPYNLQSALTTDTRQPKPNN